MKELAAGISEHLMKSRGHLTSETLNTLNGVHPRHILGTPLLFGPRDPEGALALELPLHAVKFIDNEEALGEFTIDSGVAGLDCEWKPRFHKYSAPQVSILQVAFQEKVLVFDMFKLHSSRLFDLKLCEFFNSRALKLGVSFEGDMQALRKSYPNMQFHSKSPEQYIDIVSVYQHHFKENPGGLAGLCEKLLCKRLCKTEQISNWENRPLRPSQLHYAALDAHVQLTLWTFLESLGRTEDLVALSKLPREKLEPPAKCEFCASRLHSKAECPKGAPCRICSSFTHNSAACPF